MARARVLDLRQKVKSKHAQPWAVRWSVRQPAGAPFTSSGSVRRGPQCGRPNKRRLGAISTVATA